MITPLQILLPNVTAYKLCNQSKEGVDTGEGVSNVL